jgi:hypothetical protein
MIEQVPAAAILDLDDPKVGIEAQLAHQVSFNVGGWNRLFDEAGAKRPVRWMRLFKRRLWRRAEELRGTIEPIDLNKYGTGLFGTAPS